MGWIFGVVMVAAMTYFAAEMYSIFEERGVRLSLRVTTNLSFSVPAALVVAVIAWVLIATGLETDGLLVLAFFAWAAASVVGAVYAAYPRMEPWIFIVPTGTTTLIGLAALITVNTGRWFQLFEATMLSFGLLLGGTILAAIMFVALAVPCWHRLLARPSRYTTADQVLRRATMVGFVASFLALATVAVTTSTQRHQSQIAATIETTEIQVRFMSLEARDGVPIIRFSTDHRGRDVFYTVRADTPMADLVGLGEHLQVRYTAENGRDREVIDIKMWPTPKAP